MWQIEATQPVCYAVIAYPKREMITKMEFQTNLHIVYKQQPNGIANPYEFPDVHPDNAFRIENGLLSFETKTGDEIIYVPADSIQFFYTTCDPVWQTGSSG